MIALFGLLQHTETLDCTVEINNPFDAFGAHVHFEKGVAIRPGDEVLVHGAPITIPYGESRSFRRRATITRAGLVERTWARLTGDLDMLELCEFSFTERKLS